MQSQTSFHDFTCNKTSTGPEINSLTSKFATVINIMSRPPSISTLDRSNSTFTLTSSYLHDLYLKVDRLRLKPSKMVLLVKLIMNRPSTFTLKLNSLMAFSRLFGSPCTGSRSLRLGR